ncbi:MAG: hypothetical protein WCA31_08205 [Acidimicrobiales bacterium]
MKSYRFRLAHVERIRALEERVARERFLTSLRALRQAESAYHRAREALRASEAPSGVLSSGELAWLGDQAERRAHAERQCFAALARAAQANDLDRESWREAAKRARALERLDERARVEWLDDYRREEAMELDDVVNARYVPAGVKP